MEYLHKQIKQYGDTILWTHLSFSTHEVQQLRHLQEEARGDTSPPGQRAVANIEEILNQIEQRRSEGFSYDYAVGLQVYKTMEKSIYRIDITSIYEAAHLVRGGKRHVFDVSTIDSPFRYYGRTDSLGEKRVKQIQATNQYARLIPTAICPSLLPLIDFDDYDVLGSYDEIVGTQSKTWDIPSFLRMCALYTSGYKSGKLDNVTQRLTGLILTKLSREYAECHLNERLDRAFSENGLTNEERLREIIPLDDEKIAKRPKSGCRLTNANNLLVLGIYHLMGKQVPEDADDFFQHGHQWYTGDFLSKMLPAELVEYLRNRKKTHGIHDSCMTLMTSHGCDLRNDFEDQLANIMFEFPYGGMDQFREYYNQHMKGYLLRLYGETGNELFDGEVDNLILAGETDALFLKCFSARAMKMSTRQLQHMPIPA